MPLNKRSQERPESPSEYGTDDELWLQVKKGIRDPNEPRTPEISPPPMPPRPSSPGPIPEEFAFSPASPRKPARVVSQKVTKRITRIPRSSPPALPPRTSNPKPREFAPRHPQPPGRRTLQILPDHASFSIQRVVNHRLRKARPSKRPRMTKNPVSSPFNCRHCRITCTGRVQWADHLRSRRHQRQLNKKEFTCEECEVTLFNESDFRRHLNGVHHRLRVVRFN